MRDVEVGVEAQLAEPPAGAHRPLEQLVAEQPVGRVERLGGAEQLLLLVLPLAADRFARRLGERRRRERGAAVVDARVAEHHPGPGAGDRPRRARGAAPPPRWSCSAATSGEQQRVGDRLRRAEPRAPPCRPEHVHVVGLERDRTRRARRPGPPRAPARSGSSCSRSPGVGDGGDRAREFTRRRLRRAPRVRGRELAEPRERPQPLDDVGLRGEQLVAAQPEPVDQPVDVQVRARSCRSPPPPTR